MPKETKFDNAICWFKNQPVIYRILVVGAIVIAVAAIIGAFQTIKSCFFPSKPPTPVINVQLPGQEPQKCKLDSLPQKPFQHKNSTKILIAVFEGGREEAKKFGTDISMCIADRLDEYCKDSLGLSVEDIEPVRLNCFVQNHSEAREILDSLGGDVFIWGNNFCSPTSEKAIFCPKATLTKRISPLEARGERIEVKEQLAITDLDLPALTAEEPYQLLNFIFGLHFYLRDKFKEAAIYFEKAGHEIYSNEKGIENVYQYLGYTYQFLSKNDKALNYYEKRLKILREVGDRKKQAVTLNNIGGLYDAWGKYNQAIEYYQKSLKISEEVRDSNGEGAALGNIGGVYYTRGKYDEAIAYYNKSIRIFEDIGDRKNEGLILNNKGEIYRTWGKYDQALEYYEKGLKIAEELSDRKSDRKLEELTLNNIGLVYYDRGKYDQANDYLTKSLKIAKEIGDREQEGIAINNIGAICKVWGKYDQAIQYYQRSLKIFEDIEDRKNEGVTLNNIGEIYRAWGKYDQAIEYYKKSLKIAEEIGDRKQEGVTLNNIASIYYAWGKYDQAIEYIRRSLSIFEEIGAAVEAKTARENLKRIQEEMKKR
jgi:tetratricopeptide (TPR) repeat protein